MRINFDLLGSYYFHAIVTFMFIARCLCYFNVYSRKHCWRYYAGIDKNFMIDEPLNFLVNPESLGRPRAVQTHF